MEDVAKAAQTIADFLQVFTSSGRLRLRYRVKVQRARLASGVKSQEIEGQGASDAARAVSDNANLLVEFSGPDTPILTARKGEVLNALEHVAAKILRLEPEEHDRVSFDADQFKANRDREMRESAEEAIEEVRATGQPHSFPPMSSRERRMLHLLLTVSGLPTASSGEGARRFVVLYPAGADTSVPPVTDVPHRQYDANAVQKAFRPR